LDSSSIIRVAIRHPELFGDEIIHAFVVVAHQIRLLENAFETLQMLDVARHVVALSRRFGAQRRDRFGLLRVDPLVAALTLDEQRADQLDRVLTA
jgi:hypothetical protein